MTQFKFDGKNFFKDSRLVGKVDGHHIYDNRGILVAAIDGKRIYDPHGVLIGHVDDRDLYDARGRHLATLDAIDKSIEDTTEVPIMKAALWQLANGTVN